MLAEFGASDRQIQALCRWQTDEALKVYVRLNSLKYKTLLDGAMAAKVSTARANQLQHALPFIDMYDVLRATAARPATHAPLDLDRDVLSEDDDEDDDVQRMARGQRAPPR